MASLCGLVQTYAQLFLARVGLGIGEATLNNRTDDVLAATAALADILAACPLGRQCRSTDILRILWDQKGFYQNDTFGAAADLGHKVRETVESGTVAMILDFARVPFTDVSAARAVETVVADAERAGKAIYIAGLQGEVRQTLEALNALADVQAA